MVDKNSNSITEALERLVAERTAALAAAHQELTAQYEDLFRSQQSLQRRGEIQSVLREIAEAAVVSSSPDELYAKVHQSVEQVFPSKNFYIALLDPSTGLVVRPYCTAGLFPVPRQRKAGRGLTEFVMQLGRALYADHAELNRLRECGAVSRLDAPSHCYLGAPLKDSAGNSFGVIALTFAENERSFHPEDLEALTIIAAQVSMAIERRKATAALVEERNLLMTLINAIPDRIFVKDRECRFLLNNAAHLEALGARSQTEATGKTDFDFRPAALANQYYADDINVMENNLQIINREEPTKLPSGEPGTLLATKVPFFNSSGEVIGLFGISRNITKSKQAEQDLRRNAQIQSVLREIAEAATLSLSLDELYAKVHTSMLQVLPAKNLYVNRVDENAGLLLFPYCVDETNTIPKQNRPLGKGLSEYVMKQRKADCVTPAELSRLRESGEVEVRLVDYHMWAGAPLTDSRGTAFGVIAFFLVAEDTLPLQPKDLEVLSIIAAQVSMAIERKQAEEALRESDATHFSLLQNATVGIVLRDRTGQITYSNPAFSRMVQAQEPEELLGTSYLSFVHPEDREESLRRIASNIGGAAAKGREHRLRGLQGRTIYVESTGVPITKGGQPYVMGVFHDITERKEAVAALQELTEKLEIQVAIRTQDLFAANEELTAINEEMTAMNEEMTAINQTLLGTNQKLEAEIDIRLQKEAELSVRERQYSAITNLLIQPVEQTESLLQTILRNALQLINAPEGYIGLYEERQNEFVIHYALGAAEADIGKTQPGDTGLRGEVLRTGETMWTEDLTSLIIVPLRHGNNIIGALSANWVQFPHRPTE